MPETPAPFRLIRHPLRLRRVHVVSAETLTPKMRRLTLGGDDLSDFVSLAPEDHVRVFFPVPGSSEPALPDVHEGRVSNPDNKPIHARDYTPLRFDAEQKSLQIDFFLHGHGVAARWAANARPGDVLGLAGPRGSFLFEASFPRHVFIGDETSLPEFFLRMEAFPADVRCSAVIVVNGSEEQQPSDHDVAWVHRSATSDVTAKVLQRIDALAPFSTDTFFWLAGEAGQTRDALHHLAAVHRVKRSHMRASGHWKRGASNHDHHTPIEAS